MKRLLIPLSLALLAVTAVVLWRGWPHLFPSSDVSDLYRRYENNEYIRATEIHNFRVNDTLAVETLLLEASTDSAWCALLLDFGMPEEMIEMYKSNKEFFMSDGANSIIMLYRDKNNQKKILPSEDPDSRLVLASFSKQSMCVFLAEDNNKKEIIELSEIIKLKHK